mmetsp:Transcript_28298/g.25080  ORF Transcript_28298/g.25080 Transcript_28298/m.25080 type:complete len:210 (+) Transcript_28298:398-1027(+)
MLKFCISLLKKVYETFDLDLVIFENIARQTMTATDPNIAIKPLADPKTMLIKKPRATDNKTMIETFPGFSSWNPLMKARTAIVVITPIRTRIPHSAIEGLTTPWMGKKTGTNRTTIMLKMWFMLAKFSLCIFERLIMSMAANKAQTKARMLPQMLLSVTWRSPSKRVDSWLPIVIIEATKAPKAKRICSLEWGVCIKNISKMMTAKKPK